MRRLASLYGQNSENTRVIRSRQGIRPVRRPHRVGRPRALRRFSSAKRLPASTVSFRLPPSGFRLPSSFLDHCVRFDFHQHFGIDEATDLHHRGRRTNRAKHLAVRPANRFPVTHDIGHVDTRSDDVIECGARALQCLPDICQRLQRLRPGVPLPHQRAVLTGRGGAGHENARTDSDRA